MKKAKSPDGKSSHVSTYFQFQNTLKKNQGEKKPGDAEGDKTAVKTEQPDTKPKILHGAINFISRLQKKEEEKTGENEAKKTEANPKTQIETSENPKKNWKEWMTKMGSGKSTSIAQPTEAVTTEKRENEDTENVQVDPSMAAGSFDIPEDEGGQIYEDKADEIITESREKNQRLHDDPPLILVTDRLYLNDQRLWPYFALYFLDEGVGKTDLETGERRVYAFSERFEISTIENGQWLVFGISTAAVNEYSEDAIINDTENQRDESSEETFTFNYIEEELITEAQRIEQNWHPVYSGFSDPEYGKDISMDRELTGVQKEKYNWDKIRIEWKNANPSNTISYQTLNRWIRKNLAKGWQQGDVIPNLKEIKVKFDEATDTPTIQAMTYNEAWKKAGEIGLRRNADDPFYWENTLTGERTKTFYNFAAPDVYYNRTHLTLEKKGTYVHVMAQILGDESLKAPVMAEKGFESRFADLVKQTQFIMGLKSDGKMTPQMIDAFGKRSAQLYNNQKIAIQKKKEAEATYEDGKFIDSGIDDDLGRSLIRYYYHNKLYASKYIKYGKIYLVVEASKSGDWSLDDYLYNLTTDEMFYLDFDTRIRCLKILSNDYVIPEEDERSLLWLVKYAPPHDHAKIAKWIKDNPVKAWKVKHEVENENYKQDFNNVAANQFDYRDKKEVSRLKTEVDNNTSDADTKAFELPDKTLSVLEYDNKEYNEKTGEKEEEDPPSLRIKTIQVVANGYRVGGNDEATLIRYMTILPGYFPDDNEAKNKVNAEVAKKIRAEIAKALVHDNATFLERLHNVTGGSELIKLRKVIDDIFDENGQMYADMIIKAKKNTNLYVYTHSRLIHQASRNVFKYMSIEDRLDLIKTIRSSSLNYKYIIVEILESVGMPLKPAADEKAALNAQRLEINEKQKFHDQIVKNKINLFGTDEHPVTGDNLIEIKRLLNSMDDKGSASRRVRATGGTGLSRSERREEIQYMSEKDLRSLTVGERVQFLSLLVEMNGSGWDRFILWTDDAAEQAAVNIIRLTPKEQSIKFSEWLYSKVKHYEIFKSAIDNSEYNLFHQALETLATTKKLEEAMPSKQLAEIEKMGVEGDLESQFKRQEKYTAYMNNKKKVEAKDRQELEDMDLQKMSHKKVIPWGRGKNAAGQDLRYDHEMELVKARNGAGTEVKINVTKYTAANGKLYEENSPTLYFSPDEMIGVYFIDDMDGVAEQYELLKMPAINFDRILNEEFKAQVWQGVEIVLLLLSFVPLLRGGLTLLAKAIAYADAIIMTLSTIIHNNKKMFPAWFVEAFFYVEMASMVFILVGNPKKIADAEKQLGKVDDGLRLLENATEVVPGLKESGRLLRETLYEEIQLAKAIEKADEPTLRKVLQEIEQTSLRVVDDAPLVLAIEKRLKVLGKGTIKASDEVAAIQGKTRDAVFNKAQDYRQASRRAGLAEQTVQRTEKTAKAVSDGNHVIIKLGDKTVKPVFSSTERRAKWLETNKTMRYIDAAIPEELSPEMHPWFYGADGKLFTPATHPHLYNAGKPRKLTELFGDSNRFEFLQSLGDLHKAGAYTPVEIGAMLNKAEQASGPQTVASFRSLLAKEGVELSTVSDEVLEEVMRKNRLLPDVPGANPRQRKFLQETREKLLRGEIDDTEALKLDNFNKLKPSSGRSTDNVIEEIRNPNRQMSADGLFSNINKAKRSTKFRPETMTLFRQLGVEIPENLEKLFAVHHIFEFSTKNKKFAQFLSDIGFDIESSFQNGLPLLRYDYAELIKLNNPLTKGLSKSAKEIYKEFPELKTILANRPIIEVFPHMKIWEKMPKHRGSHIKEYGKYIEKGLDGIILNTETIIERNVKKGMTVEIAIQNAYETALRQAKELASEVVENLEQGTLKLNK